MRLCRAAAPGACACAPTVLDSFLRLDRDLAAGCGWFTGFWRPRFSAPSIFSSAAPLLGSALVGFVTRVPLLQHKA